jgi:hypothetical protein
MPSFGRYALVEVQSSSKLAVFRPVMLNPHVSASAGEEVMAATTAASASLNFIFE